MAIKKLDDGRYEVDIRPRGRDGKRIRRKFERKAEALAFERYTIANASQKEWGGQRADRRTLSELLDIWWKYHGQNHEHGTKEFNHLLKTISGIGDIPVSRMSKRALMDYRSMRLRDGISAATINRDMYRLIALQQILGHASIQQTMAYAHLAPDYLQNAVALNPLKGGVTL